MCAKSDLERSFEVTQQGHQKFLKKWHQKSEVNIKFGPCISNTVTCYLETRLITNSSSTNMLFCFKIQGMVWSDSTMFPKQGLDF